MNYIPGFTNYLQASVPQYANGGRVDYNEPMMYGDYGGYGDPMAAPIMEMPREAAVMPMTQEAAPFDLSSLAGLDLSGLGGFGGGRMGGVIQDPNIQYIGAPVSNKGNPTGRMGGNVFAVTPDQPVRLVDLNTKTVVFEGTGADAARKATEIGQNLTDTMGRKASYDIQTADPSGSYVTVANEKKNKSTLGQIANVAGTALPLALLAIPGAGPALFGMTSGAFAASLPAQLAFGALTGAASSGLKGQNVLKGAALGGLTAAGGAMLPKIPAIGDLGDLAKPLGVGLGATAGGLATGQSLKNSLLGGAASGALAYAAPGIQKSLGIGQGVTPSTGTSPSTGTGGIDPSVMATVTGYTAPSAGLSFSGSSSGAQPKVQDPYDGLKVIGNKFGNFSGLDAGNVFGTSSGPSSAFDTYFGADKTAPLTEDEILVEARKAFNTSPIATDFLPKGGLPKPMSTETVSPEEILVEARKPFTTNVPVGGALSPEVLRAINGPVENDIIKVTGRQTTTPALIPGFDTPMPETPEEAEAKKKKLGLEEYLRLAGLASGLIGGAAGGGSGGSGTYGGSGTGRLNPIFSAKLPSAGGLGSIGMNRTQRPMGDVDWLTYGTRPELSFFDYAPRAASPTPAALPTPVTTPMPSNPAGPIMAEEPRRFDEGRLPPRFAEGGAFAAKGGGLPKRTEFAVNGAGTGRSDDIPAVLSDGEYVIDAETVALLGDGSNKAGAKKLDELRIKVRKHKGRKLAKGRFSANAKKPEAYLSGGRI